MTPRLYLNREWDGGRRWRGWGQGDSLRRSSIDAMSGCHTLVTHFAWWSSFWQFLVAAANAGDRNAWLRPKLQRPEDRRCPLLRQSLQTRCILVRRRRDGGGGVSGGGRWWWGWRKGVREGGEEDGGGGGDEEGDKEQWSIISEIKATETRVNLYCQWLLVSLHANRIYIL